MNLPDYAVAKQTDRRGNLQKLAQHYLDPGAGSNCRPVEAGGVTVTQRGRLLPPSHGQRTVPALWCRDGVLSSGDTELYARV
jgi:hypothetical protein